jgi:hypothetical protein
LHLKRSYDLQLGLRMLNDPSFLTLIANNIFSTPERQQEKVLLKTKGSSGFLLQWNYIVLFILIPL